MIRNISKYSLLVAAVLCQEWFRWNAKDGIYSWEPVIAFAAAISGYFTLEYLIQREISARYRERDRLLFDAFMNAIPGPMIEFIRTHDFRSEYPGGILNPLFRYSDAWNDAEHVFMSKRIETIHKKFKQSVSEFLDEIVRRTHPMDGTLYTVHPREGEYDENVDVQRMEEESISLLNRAARAVCTQYQDFVLLSRQRLQHPSRKVPVEELGART